MSVSILTGPIGVLQQQRSKKSSSGPLRPEDAEDAFVHVTRFFSAGGERPCSPKSDGRTYSRHREYLSTSASVSQTEMDIVR
jgi:hypothetical protein